MSISNLPAPPKRRKSPVRHIVHAYVRQRRTRVSQYWRGRGERAAEPKKPTRGAGVGGYLTGNKFGFGVKIDYDNGKSESLDVDAVDDVNALDRGFAERTKGYSVHQVVISRL